MRDRLTYRYPRTLIEAFGCDADSANAVHGPYKKDEEMTWVLTLLLFFGLLGLLGGLL